MSKTQRDKISANLIKFLAKIYNKIKSADYTNPRITLTAIGLVILPFVAWYYISTGFVLGLMLSISILYLVEKSPDFIKQLISEYPLAADIILSTLAVVSIGGYFGSGLVLGLGAVFSTVFLSWALTEFARKYEHETKTQAETS